MTEFKRENRYVVIKREDIEAYLTNDKFLNWRALFYSLCDDIEKGRIADGKPLNNYIVVNQDEPYAEAVWKLIETNGDCIKQATSKPSPEELVEKIKMMLVLDVRDCPQYEFRAEVCAEDCITCMALKILSLCQPSPDKVREKIIEAGRYFRTCAMLRMEPEDSEINRIVKEICGG